MPSLRSYRDRIKSVKSTRKITSAMKMVAASKLRRAQDQAERSRAYAVTMAEMLARVARNVVIGPSSSRLLVGTGAQDKHLLVVVSADRGLCGGFNANIVREARRAVQELTLQGKDVKVLCVGRKGRDVLNRDMRSRIVKGFTGLTGKNRVEFAAADEVTQYILEQFEAGAFDICTLIYNEFVSVLAQKPVRQQLIPFNLEEALSIIQEEEGKPAQIQTQSLNSPYDFEPTEEEILNALLPKNIGVQIFRALLDSAAGEQAARMTAMDNATRNAGDMIKRLTLQYNRARQAYITKELIEIISGAEAI
jgi:F-type H+-transporting ATPase subunit gamma